MASGPILEIIGVKKTFRIGFARKVVEAVRGIDFTVQAGEIFGFLGPNGAGKTTTIKMVMDLIRPNHGEIRLFGRKPSHLEARGKVGYLPEQPYFHDYLKPMELLDFFGQLHGLKSSVRRKRAQDLIERVGLGHAADRTLRRYSKGMLQRFGMAQALIADPELVILDEPLGGLDPIGRKELKDIIAELRKAGKTVFFSSHILADIELLCDKIAMVNKGRLIYTGPTRDFLQGGQREVEIVAAGVTPEIRQAIQTLSFAQEDYGERVKILCHTDRADEVVAFLVRGEARVESVVPRSETLEEIFVKTASQDGGA